MTEAEIQYTMAEVLSKRLFLPNVSPDKITVKTEAPNQAYRLTIRLGKDYKVLPTPEKVIDEYNRTGKQGEGAPWLMFGMVQVAGNKVRVTARIVKTETGDVVRASLGDGENSAEGLLKAFETALLKLNIGYVC
jgi:hypothetical protein